MTGLSGLLKSEDRLQVMCTQRARIREGAKPRPVSAQGIRFAEHSQGAPTPDMDMPARGFLFAHEQPVFIIAI